MLSYTSATTGQSAQGAARLPYLPGLDGLRAIAVTAVLLYHGGLNLRGGFLGVESFFVLSGFLITALLLAEWRRQGRVSLTGFWLRRARRLLPALFLLLAATLLYTIVALPWKTAEVRGDVVAALGYVTNWHLVFSQQSYFDAAVRPPLLRHLWSLAVEEQFYLLWPLLFSAGMRYVRAKGLLLLTLAMAAASVALMALLYRPGADPSRVYYGTDTRAAGLLLGAALALAWTPERRPGDRTRGVGRILDLAGLLGLGGLIAAYFRVYEQQTSLYRGGFALVALCTAVVIMAITHPDARLTPAALGWQPLRWIGLRSYGIYLWYWPVFQVTRPYLDVPLRGWPLLLLRLAIIGVLVEFSYRWIELPVRGGAIKRTWRAASARRGMIAIHRNGRLLGRRWLLLPLGCALLLAGALWLARMDAPRAAAPLAVSPRGAAASGPIHTPAPATVTASPKASPAPAGAMRPATNPTAILPAPVAAKPTTVAASSSTTTSPETPPAASGARPRAATPRPDVSPSPAGQAPLDPALAKELQRLLDDTVADGFVPGAVLSVSMPGYLPWSGASGVADRQRDLPMQPDTLVRIGSVTKMFTAAVVLQLAQEGKIDLDAPIGVWLPDIVQFADTTTVRQLLSHRSGIFDYLEDPQFYVEAYQNPQHTYTPGELVAMVDQLGAAFKPGTAGAWKYASTNYVILGMLVEKVTGRPLAQEMRRRIFDPLKLTHTFFAPNDAIEGALAEGYIDASNRADVSMTFVYATGNIISTADDLRRFADNLLGGRLLSPATRTMMATLVDTGGAYGMPELQYGLGLMGARLNVGPRPDGTRRPDEASTVLGHIGGIAGFRSAVWWAPESSVTIALGLNQADIDPNLLARDVMKAILTWQGR